MKKLFWCTLFVFLFPPLFAQVKFVTLESVNDIFVIRGKVTKVNSYATIAEAPIELKPSLPSFTAIRFTGTGYFSMAAELDGAEQLYSVFVSPVPSVHAGKVIEDIDWYLTQFNSGTVSNCGPASCAMVISWVLGDIYPVAAVRSAVGWQGDGGTSFEELIPVIKKNNVSAEYRPLKSFNDIKQLVDDGGIAIVLFNTNGVRNVEDNPLTNFFGKYYDDDAGHYIVVKGYSRDGKYLVVHDPVPSDWAFNRLRYSDGRSMIGKNRYYSTNELLSALRRRDMIAVKR